MLSVTKNAGILEVKNQVAVVPIYHMLLKEFHGYAISSFGITHLLA